MGETGSATKVSVVRATAWKDAIIKILEPRSPYRPWRIPAGIQRGDAIIAVLDTQPASVIADIRTVGPDDSAVHALESFLDHEDSFDFPPVLEELATLQALTGVAPDGETTVEAVAAMTAEWNDCARGPAGLEYLNGHSSLAAARILLESKGRCDGCNNKFELAGADARDHVHIHTVDVDPNERAIAVADDPVPPPPPPPDPADVYGAGPILTGLWRALRVPADWPAALCESCHDRMRAGGFTNFLRFRFSLHPPCPSCAAQWTMRTRAGWPVYIPVIPWIRHTGCCPDPRWLCGACGHKWGPTYNSVESPRSVL